jgi:hypothetical protein
MLRWLVTWLVTFVIVLTGLTLIALTIGGSIGPLEFGTAFVIGVLVAMRRRARERDG